MAGAAYTRMVAGARALGQHIQTGIWALESVCYSKCVNYYRVCRPKVAGGWVARLLGMDCPQRAVQRGSLGYSWCGVMPG